MSAHAFDSDALDDDARTGEVFSEVRREAALLKTGALQNQRAPPGGRKATVGPKPTVRELTCHPVPDIG